MFYNELGIADEASVAVPGPFLYTGSDKSGKFTEAAESVTM